MEAPCDFCGEAVRVGRPGTFTLVTGWGERRAAGGIHAVRLPEMHDKHAHGHCIDAARRGHRRGQQSLADDIEAHLDAAIAEELPIYDGTQTGLTAVRCHICMEAQAAKHMAKHVEAKHP